MSPNLAYLLYLCLAASTVAVQQPSEDAVSGLEVCPWTPLIPELELSCRNPPVPARREASAQGSEDEKVPAPEARDEDQGWTGPHQCADEFCVYSSKRFFGGRGVALITTLDNLKLFQAIERSLIARDGDIGNPATAPFEATRIEGKGTGLVANTSIARGAAIMAYPPVLLAHRTFVERPGAATQTPLLEEALSLLPPATREAYLGQLAHLPGPRALSVLMTNSFQVNVDSGGGSAAGQHYASYPEVARLNHDCRPNAALRIDANLVHHTTAARAAAPGAELTISYLDPLAPRAERRARARDAWGFECGCGACGAAAGREGEGEGEEEEENALASSDARLAEIRRLDGVLSAVRRGGAKVTKDLVVRYLRLHYEERLEARLASALVVAALNYNMLGLPKLGTKHAELALEALEIERGPDTADAKVLREMMASPKTHFTWRLRVK